MTAGRRLLVTAALPYANGHIHLGHLVEYLQTDIWVRFQRLRGHECRFFCADDTHGTAIMMRARQEGRSEVDVIRSMQAAHERDFADFGIAFDHYGSTHSPENETLCREIWKSIRAAGLVREKSVAQLFDPQAGMFLADRLVRGTCPNPACGAADQPGDNCSVCGHHYNPAELLHPVSALSGTTPEVRSEAHLFIELEQLHPFLSAWTQTGERLQPEIANYLQGHFLHEPLRDWDVSRPAPYFGFEIPDALGNYWYVWFDAPIGYIAATRQWCDRTNDDVDRWWKSEECEIHHFIGKDIAYFHTLFWPAMLRTAGYCLPTKVHIHGFLTVDGEKMSKSKGTFVLARTYLNRLDPAYLRYFYAAKLSSKVDDIDLSLDEFSHKVNTDLVGKVVNLASRTAKFVASTGLAARYPDDSGLFATGAAAGDEIAAAYEECDYSRAMRKIMALADQANRYVDDHKPWELSKNPAEAQRLQDVCTVTLNLFRQLVVFLAPVLPRLAEQTSELLGKPVTRWDESQTPLTSSPVAKFQHMLKRIEIEDLRAMIEDSKSPEQPASASSERPAAAGPSAGPIAGPTPPPAAPAIVDPLAELRATTADADVWRDGGEALAAEPLAPECSIDDFVKVDLRVARIVAAEAVDGADKLLRLQLSLGGGSYRQVFAGIKKYYEPSSLVGRLVICVANLKPRKMKFGVSEGMIAAAGGGDSAFLLTPDEGAVPGQRLH